jgi:hypothetical protein
MRIVLLMVLAGVVGVAAGVGAAVLRVRVAPWHDEVGDGVVGRQARPADANSLSPKVAVDEAEHKFGVQDVESQGQHDFVIRNVGTAPLRLTKGATTCSCVLSDLEQGEIPPGGSTKATLQWKSKGVAGDYEQSGTILTNDPETPRVKLKVSGRFVSAVRANPSEVQFSSIPQSESSTTDVRISTHLAQLLEIEGYEFSDRSLAKFFEVAVTPLTPGQLKEEEDAQSGYQMRISVKSGLPLGAFRQTITVKTNIEKRPTVEVPLQGLVVGDISIVGPRWHADKGVLALNSVSGQEGGRWRLTILTRGPHRKEVKFKPVRVEPDLLKVELGETIPINDGVVMQTSLVIEIPKGSRPANYLGTVQSPAGRITIETNHPKAPRLEIRVAFAVEG